MEKYKVLRLLGEGAFGRVLEACENGSSERLAIKHIKKEFSSWEGTGPRKLKINTISLASSRLSPLTDVHDDRVLETPGAQSA